MLPGTQEDPPRATHPDTAAEARRNGATKFQQNMSLLQRLQTMHRFPVDRRGSRSTVRDRYEVHEAYGPVRHMEYMEGGEDGAAPPVAQVSVVFSVLLVAR